MLLDNPQTLWYSDAGVWCSVKQGDHCFLDSPGENVTFIGQYRLRPRMSTLLVRGGHDSLGEPPLELRGLMGRELAKGDPLAQPRISVGVKKSGTPRTRESWFVNAAIERLLVRYGSRLAMVMSNSGYSPASAT